jgi:hypothetical protein
MLAMFGTKKMERDLDKLMRLKAVVDEKARKQQVREARQAAKLPPAPPKPKPTPEDIAADYHEVRRRVIKAIADEYILDSKGREVYLKTASAYAVLGKYKVNAAFIDFDHELRDINVMAGGPARNKVIKSLAKRLGLRA